MTKPDLIARLWEADGKVTLGSLHVRQHTKANADAKNPALNRVKLSNQIGPLGGFERADGELLALLWNERKAILALAEERDRMREALEYYANPDMYDSGEVPGHIYALDDKGYIGRRALSNSPSHPDDPRSTMEILGEIAGQSGFKPTKKYLGAMFLGYDYARRRLAGLIGEPARKGKSK